MAAFIGILQTAEIAFSAGLAKTIIQLTAPTNHRVKLLRWKISFDGVSPTEAPVQVRLLRQTSAGVMNSLNPVKQDDSISDTLLCTGSSGYGSTEPSASDVLDNVEVHPQSGYEVIYPYGMEVIVGGGDRIGIEVNAPAAVNGRAVVVFEE